MAGLAVTVLQGALRECGNENKELGEQIGLGIIAMGGPEDFGSRPDEHRFRIDNYLGGEKRAPSTNDTGDT